jgi:dihydroneopterin aldolase
VSTDVILITGVKAFGYHGVLAEEREKGQVFVTDVELRLDVRAAAARDELSATVDYSAVAAQVVAVVEGEPCQLIETVADRIAGAVLDDDRVDAVRVTVHKPEAPLGVPFADVSVSVLRSR